MHGNPGMCRPILLGLALSFLILGAPVAGAEEPFIAIDPVGDHVIGEVFFINGTTNLPAMENLTMEIEKIPVRTMKNTQNPHVVVKYIPIVKPSSGTIAANFWSVDVTDSVKELSIDDESVCGVTVWSSQNDSIYTIGGGFRLLPNTSATPTMTAPLFIAIDPIGDHTIGEVFFINGTTNLPVTDNLTLEISIPYHRTQKTPTSEPYVMITNIPVVAPLPGEQGMNHWSVNVTEHVKELGAGVYDADAFWSSLDDATFSPIVQFSLLPNPNVTVTTVPQVTPPGPVLTQLISGTTTAPATTPSSPLPAVLPVAGVAAVGIWEFIRRKKNG